MKAIEYLKDLPREWLPKNGIGTPVSNSELGRWLKDGAVVINESRPKSLDEVTFPIKRLVFFPKGKRKTTII